MNTNLIALLLWLGFRRQFIGYSRVASREGKGAWTLSKRLEYCLNSIFSFTDLPVRFLLWSGAIGSVSAVVASVAVLAGQTSIATSESFSGQPARVAEADGAKSSQTAPGS